MKWNENDIDLVWRDSVKGGGIFLKNTGKEVIRVVETHPLRDYRFIITRAGAEKIPMTSKGQLTLKAVTSLPPAKRITILLNPEEVYKIADISDLQEWFLFKGPGRYEIEVRENDWEQNDHMQKGGVVNIFIGSYSILAWTAGKISVGRLEVPRLRMEKVIGFNELEDIRNCTLDGENNLCAVTGINKGTKDAELLILSVKDGQVQTRITANHLLMNAISPSGKLVAYTALPSDNENGMSLYVYDLASGLSSLHIEAEVHRDCIPSWLPSSGKILFHTNRQQVIEWDIKERQATILFDGSFPAMSLDGALIAFRKGNKLFILAKESGEEQELSIPLGFWSGPFRKGMSWSPDNKYLLAGYSSGILGYELTFCTIEVPSAKFGKIKKSSRGELGLQFIKSDPVEFSHDDLKA